MEPQFPTPPPAFAPPPPPRPRWGLHVALFAATCGTTFLAGLGWAVGGWVLPWHAWPLLRAEPALWLPALRFSGCVMAILLAHETGHYLYCLRYRVPATPPFFLPAPLPMIGTFGALIRVRGAFPNRNALFDMAAAGPLAGYAVALPVLVWGLLRGTAGEPVEGGLVFGDPIVSKLLMRALGLSPDLFVDEVYIAGWFGMIVTSLNLMPVGQLDGGHVVYAFSARAHRIAGDALLLGLLVKSVIDIASGGIPAYVLFIILLFLFPRRHPPVVDETVPLSPGRRAIAFGLLLVFVTSAVPQPFL